MFERDPGGGASKDFYHNTELSNQAAHIGTVIEFYPKTHRADVAMHIPTAQGRPLVLRYLPVEVSYGGKNWGEFRGLRRGQLVGIELNNGSFVNAKITQVLYAENSEPSPKHPMLTENDGGVMAYAVQTPINDDKTPGNFTYRGADGVVAEVVLVKRLEENSGSEVTRASGPAFSAPEARLSEGQASLKQAGKNMDKLKQSTRAGAVLAGQLSDAKKKVELLSKVPDNVSKPGGPASVRGLADAEGSGSDRVAAIKEVTELTLAIKNHSIDTAELGETIAKQIDDSVQAAVESAAQIVETTRQNIETALYMAITGTTLDPTAGV